MVPHASWHSFFTDRLGQLVKLMEALGEQYLYNRWHERNGLDPHPLYTCTNLVERSLAALADSAQADSNASHGGHNADYLKRCWEGDYVWLQRLALNSPHATNQLDKWLTAPKVYHPDFQYDLSRLLRDRRPSPDVLEAWLSFAENADNDVTQRHFAANYAVTALHHNAAHASELKARAEAIRVQAKARVIDITVYQFNMPRYRPEYASLPQLSAATTAEELIAWVDGQCAIASPDWANNFESTKNLSQVPRTVLIACLHTVTQYPQRPADGQPPTRRQEILARLFRILAGSKPVELPCNKDFERELDLRLANHDDPFFRTILLPYWCTYYQPHLGAAERSRRCILALQGFNFGQLGLTEQHIRKFPDNRHSHSINTDTEGAVNQSLNLATELANDGQLAAVDAISKLTDDSDLLFAFLIDMERVRAILECIS